MTAARARQTDPSQPRDYAGQCAEPGCTERVVISDQTTRLVRDKLNPVLVARGEAKLSANEIVKCRRHAIGHRIHNSTLAMQEWARDVEKAKAEQRAGGRRRGSFDGDEVSDD